MTIPACLGRTGGVVTHPGVIPAASIGQAVRAVPLAVPGSAALGSGGGAVSDQVQICRALEGLCA
jgi:hypothetical protein